MSKKKKPIFEWDKIVFEGQHLTDNANCKYKVSYKTYESDSLEFKQPTNNPVCYSGFMGAWRQNEKLNRVSTEIDIQPTTVTLTREECVRWVELAQLNAMLPWYIKPEDTILPHPEKEKWHLGRLVLLCMDMPQSTLYMYLDTFRHMREDPGFVKAILYLVDEIGMNFYIAYVLSSHTNIKGEGHHTIKVTRGPYGANKPNPSGIDGTMNLKMVRSLYKFIHDEKIDRGKRVPKASGWDCNNLIAKLTTIDLSVPVQSLLDPAVEAIVKEKDCKKAEKLHKKLK